MRSLEKRLEKLEQVYSPPEIMFIYLEFVGLYVGEIVACSYGWGDVDKTGCIWREPEEPEKDFLERVEPQPGRTTSPMEESFILFACASSGRTIGG